MISRQLPIPVLLVSLLCVVMSSFCDRANAVGVLYADPGWLHAFDGNSAYYHDPDGPHPNYVSGGDTNEPGGQSNQPALINIGACGTPANCAANAIWQNRGSEWEGSAPGDPLGGTGVFNQIFPPLPPPAPGGVGAYTDGSTSYIRIQDPGLPSVYGWADKGAQFDVGTAKQEGNNRRIEFKHEMSRDAGFSDRLDILDFGVTVSFRTRISTAATGPLDDYYSEDGPASSPWPESGVGYPITGTARGMFMISQNGAVGPSRIAFSLLDADTIADAGIPTAPTGLVMNNRAIGPGNPGSPDTNTATAATLNIVQVPDAELDDWHEFWITVKALPVPVAGNTHEVNVYADGSLVPQTFQVILGLQNESGTGSFLGMGLSSGSRHGAMDVDFIAYKEGVFAPTVAGLPGDYNDDDKVDAADYVMWRKGGVTLANDDSPGVGADDYTRWRQHFAETAAGSGGSIGNSVPEPSAFVLVLLATSAFRRPRTAHKHLAQ